MRLFAPAPLAATALLVALGACSTQPDKKPENTHAGRVLKQIEADPRWQSNPDKAALHDTVAKAAQLQARDGQRAAPARAAEERLNAEVTRYCGAHLTDPFCATYKSER